MLRPIFPLQFAKNADLLEGTLKRVREEKSRQEEVLFRSCQGAQQPLVSLTLSYVENASTETFYLIASLT